MQSQPKENNRRVHNRNSPTAFIHLSPYLRLLRSPNTTATVMVTHRGTKLRTAVSPCSEHFERPGATNCLGSERAFLCTNMHLSTCGRVRQKTIYCRLHLYRLYKEWRCSKSLSFPVAYMRKSSLRCFRCSVY